jgi:hypothetical protein
MSSVHVVEISEADIGCRRVAGLELDALLRQSIRHEVKLIEKSRLEQ